MKKGFTLAELMVSIAVLALTMAAAGTIFKMSIQAYRTANATTEIMRNLRAITDQLNADFKGLRKNAPLAIRFEIDPTDGLRYDQIVFFANGDFQSVRQYEYEPSKFKTVAGNVARLYYGQASDPNILARKQKILTADASLYPTELNDPAEYEKVALAWFKVIPLTDPRLAAWTGRPTISARDALNLHMLMTKDVGDFKIQIWRASQPRWFPSVNPDGDPDTDDSDFPADQKFGRLFNAPPKSNPGSVWSELSDWPKALKFTFTLYDSRGVLRKGMKFTHIVYIGD